MKKAVLLSVILSVCILFSACGAKSTESLRDNYEYKTESFEPENGFNYSSMDSATGTIVTAPSLAGGNVIKEEKLVHTSNVTLETEDFDSASVSLHETIKQYGGIIISENAYNLNRVNSSGYRSLDMTVRIPQEHYDAFISGLSSSYNVASIHNSVENFTERYYDNENRLKSYRIQEERLFDMLSKATTVEEMLQIEDRLIEVQYNIESITNTQQTIDNDVKYATFYISLCEVTKYTTPAPKTFGDKLVETVKNSGEVFVEVLQAILFMLIYLAPYLVITAIILIVIFACIKRSKKKKATKAKENEVACDEK